MNNITWNAREAREKTAKGSFAAKAVRKQVYTNNKQIFAAGGYETADGTAVRIDKTEMTAGTQMVREPFALEPVAEPVETQRSTVNAPCLDVAHQLTQQGYRPAVLNLADAYIPCGFYPQGSGAQEESLCRQTTLSEALYSLTYPMEMNYGGVYTPHCLVFRAGADRGFELLSEPWETAIISVAALDFNEKHGKNLEFRDPYGRINDEGKVIMRNKIRTIFRLAAQGGHDALVLGAFGCGAFRLIPLEVAHLFDAVLHEPEFEGRFRKVVFAILSRPEDVSGKFAPFYRLFC